jgi:uncharacterized protein YaaW (UPF0174 family)
VYAFVSPDNPGTVTLIANYIPLEGPAGGPNFYAFGDEVLYEIHVDNDADARADVTYQFRFQTMLINEVLLPLGLKDLWNTLPPSGDKRFADRVAHPDLAGLLPALYPGAFPNLAQLVQSGKPRADLEAILLTGIPSGIVTGFQNFTGPVQADMLRLNTAIPPSTNPSQLGVLGGDLAGFPNG